MPFGFRRFYKKLNEKNLVLLLIILPVVTIFIIFMNLPSDLNKTVEKIQIERFVNKFHLLTTTKQLNLDDNLQQNKGLDEGDEGDGFKQQLVPPHDDEHDTDLSKMNNTMRRRDKIKEVTTQVYLHLNKHYLKYIVGLLRWHYLLGAIMKSMHGARTS
jgi:hypothetical protein